VHVTCTSTANVNVVVVVVVVLNVVLVVVVHLYTPARPDLPKRSSCSASQRLDVYRASTQIPRRLHPSDRCGRDAGRFYAIARGSALECAAILDAFEAMGLVQAAIVQGPRETLERIVSMLTGLIRA